MGIKINNVYAKVISPENLYRSAHRTLLKGLRYKENGAGWKLRMEYHINKLHAQLSDLSYRHGKYQVFKVYDPKERTILAANITDRVFGRFGLPRSFSVRGWFRGKVKSEK